MEKVIKVNLDMLETNLFKAEPFTPDETFWTTDINSAFLEFETVQTVTGATASLVLTNAEDGAVVQRNIDVTDPTFRYMMREKEIAHAGHWYGQIVVKEEGRFITSTEFRFQVRGSVLDGSDDRLFDADNYNKLADQLFTLYEQMSALLLDVKVSEQLRENAELLRASVFESSQTARAQAFLVSENERSERFDLSEAEREEQEEARQKAESLRRSVFDAAQAERTQDFLDAESARTVLFNSAETLRREAENQRSIDEGMREVSEDLRAEVFRENETLRQQGEVLRENAEGVRATNETQRGTTFGTYDDRIKVVENTYKVQATNKLLNSNFSKGYIPWTVLNATISQLDEEVSFTATSVNGRILQQNVLNVASHKWYLSAMVKTDSSRVLLTAHGSTQGNSHSGSNNFEKLSVIVESYSTGSQSQFQILDLRTGNWTPISVKYGLLIDLTETFGAGNEPTASQMDRLLTQFPNSWFDGTQNLFLARWALNEMRRLDSEKANKKQEDWITPTLLNGVTGTFQYMKDTLGFVRFRGYLENVSFNLPVMTLVYTPENNSSAYLSVGTYKNSSASVLHSFQLTQYGTLILYSIGSSLATRFLFDNVGFK